MKQVNIRNIKHIKSLDFNLPSKAGVYTLTGGNGSGKTTLMTCLLRIGSSSAFKDYFKPGQNKFDAYDGDVTYQVGNDKVSYRHAGKRWPPRPRKNSKLFSRFGYSEVRYLPAIGTRLYIHPEAIEPSTIKGVNADLKENLNKLLETNKFEKLRYVQTGSMRGRGSGSQRWKRAYLIKYGRGKYYSESNFSLGEMLILNTLLLIEDIKPKSMLLIDELEVALHPRVQIRLLKFLEEQAVEKNITVILSTHSSSIIKSSGNIIYLENDINGNISVIENCYPAMVLKEVAIEEDIHPDYIFTVEDDMASILLQEIIKYYLKVMSKKITPIYKVIPIGGYQQVLSFSDNSKDYLFTSIIGQYIFLDADVEDVKRDLAGKGNSRTKEESTLYDLFRRLEERTHFLPIKPELGIWEWAKSNTGVLQKAINECYQGSTISLVDLLDKCEYEYRSDSSDNNERAKAKRRYKYLLGLLEGRLNQGRLQLSQFIMGEYVTAYYDDIERLNSLKALFGPIFNKRGNS